MNQFFDSDLEASPDCSYVEYDGHRMPYDTLYNILVEIAEQKDLIIDDITLRDVSRAYNEELIAYIREN